MAVDEDRALQPGQPAEERPSGDLALGDEAHRADRAQHADVEPGHVVRRDEKRPLGGQRPLDRDPDAEQPAEEAMVAHGQGPRPGRPDEQQHALHGHADEGHGRENEEDKAGAHAVSP